MNARARVALLDCDLDQGVVVNPGQRSVVNKLPAPCSLLLHRQSRAAQGASRGLNELLDSKSVICGMSEGACTRAGRGMGEATEA